MKSFKSYIEESEHKAKKWAHEVYGEYSKHLKAAYHAKNNDDHAAHEAHHYASKGDHAALKKHIDGASDTAQREHITHSLLKHPEHRHVLNKAVKLNHDSPYVKKYLKK